MDVTVPAATSATQMTAHVHMSDLSQTSDEGHLVHYMGHGGELTQLSQPSPHPTVAAPNTATATIKTAASAPDFSDDFPSATASAATETKAVKQTTAPVSPDSAVLHVPRNSGGGPALSQHNQHPRDHSAPASTAAASLYPSHSKSAPVVVQPRWGHTATRVKGGHVVVFGGDGGTDSTLREVLVYDPGMSLHEIDCVSFKFTEAMSVFVHALIESIRDAIAFCECV